jgi:hypothetical protein
MLAKESGIHERVEHARTRWRIEAPQALRLFSSEAKTRHLEILPTNPTQEIFFAGNAVRLSHGASSVTSKRGTDVLVNDTPLEHTVKHRDEQFFDRDFRPTPIAQSSR